MTYLAIKQLKSQSKKFFKVYSFLNSEKRET